MDDDRLLKNIQLMNSLNENIFSSGKPPKLFIIIRVSVLNTKYLFLIAFTLLVK